MSTLNSRLTETAILRGGPELAAGGRVRPTAQHRPLLQILAGQGEQARESLEAWCRTFDPRLPVDGGTFRLLPMVFHRMLELNFEHQVRPLLKGVYRRSLVANARLIDIVVPAVQALSDHGLNPVLLKGAALVANGSYPTLATRPMEDVDVYVDTDSRDAAFAILERLGWRVEYPPAWLRVAHAAPFRAADGAPGIDLHWHPLASVRASSADRALMTDVRAGRGLGIAATVPDPTALMLVTLIHAARPNAEPPVRWVADALRLLGREDRSIDWDRVVEFARAQQTGLVLSRMLEVLRTFAGDDVPPHIVRNLRDLPVWPVERWENRLMDGEYSSIVTQLAEAIVLASSAHRNAPMPMLLARLVREKRVIWDVPWMRMPIVAPTRFIRRAGKRVGQR